MNNKKPLKEIPKEWLAQTSAKKTRRGTLRSEEKSSPAPTINTKAGQSKQ